MSVPLKKHNTIGFIHAFHGLRYALLTQSNFRFQIFAAFLTFFLAVYLKLSPFEWLILILTVFFVLTTELINSAIEIWVDSGILEANIYAKRVKDIAAASVFLSVLGATLIGIMIFLPRLLVFFPE